MIEGSLIQCPVCQNAGKTQYLGRILNSGELCVLRFHHGTTLIRALEYQISCGCGYSLSVQGTVMVPSIPVE